MLFRLLAHDKYSAAHHNWSASLNTPSSVQPEHHKAFLCAPPVLTEQASDARRSERARVSDGEPRGRDRLQPSEAEVPVPPWLPHQRRDHAVAGGGEVAGGGNRSIGPRLPRRALSRRGQVGRRRHIPSSLLRVVPIR